MVYGFIGTGSIAAAMVAGLCRDAATARPILLSPRNAGVAADLARRFPNVRVAASNQAVVDGASILILCLRPPAAQAVLRELTVSPHHHIISVMAGLALDVLQPLLTPAASIARAIPLPSVANQASITPIHPATPAAAALFSQLGGANEVSAAGSFEAFSAASATLSTHFATLGTIADWLTAQGIDPVPARRHIAAMFAGAARSLEGADPNFDHLAKEYATEGGLNEQFQKALASAGLFKSATAELDRILQRLTDPKP